MKSFGIYSSLALSPLFQAQNASRGGFVGILMHKPTGRNLHEIKVYRWTLEQNTGNPTYTISITENFSILSVDH